MVVTGANGFLGSYVVAALLSEANTVVGIKRENGDTRYFHRILQDELGDRFDTLIKNFEWRDADILDICALDEILSGQDVVFHCAASVTFNKKDKEAMLAVNRDGTANVVNACLKNNIRKMVHVSSTAALGRSEMNQQINEDREWDDSDHNTNYAISKHLAELEVWRGIEEGLDAVIVNPGIILGAGNWNSGSCRMFKNIREGFHFYTEGVNGFVGVKDVAGIMVSLAGSDISAQRFLVVAENKSYKAVLDAIADGLHKDRPRFELKKSYRSLLMFLARVLLIFNRRSTVTPETVSTSMKEIVYDNQKIKRALNFQFTPIDVVIQEATGTYQRYAGQ